VASEVGEPRPLVVYLKLGLSYSLLDLGRGRMPTLCSLTLWGGVSSGQGKVASGGQAVLCKGWRNARDPPAPTKGCGAQPPLVERRMPVGRGTSATDR
jgi:hypothetical protein